MKRNSIEPKSNRPITIVHLELTTSV